MEKTIVWHKPTEPVTEPKKILFYRKGSDWLYIGHKSEKDSKVFVSEEGSCYGYTHIDNVLCWAYLPTLSAKEQQEILEAQV